ncbi:MAG: hypothetical protein PVH29_06940 [Candidatus Zixiibacteriota bacterium]|jgi:hypothetical protein
MRRGKVLTAIVASALAAGAASATTYLDEDFHANQMPTGWSAKTSGSGSVAYGFIYEEYTASVLVNDGQAGTVELTSFEMTVPAGTLYYSFEYYSYAMGSGTIRGEFAAEYAGTSTEIYRDSLSGGSRHVEAGSFYVAEPGTIVVVWVYRGGAAPGRYAEGEMFMDDAVITDVPNAGVDPSSLGRVRALFR